MSIDDATVSFSLEVNVEEAFTEIRRIQTLLHRTLGLMVRLTGSEGIGEGIRQMQRAIAIANQLRLTLAALQAARLAVGDPLAWAMVGISGADVLMSAGDIIMDLG